MERIDKINYYLDIADKVSERGTCLRRNYGSVIVKNDEIISTGYTGAPRGRSNCCDTGECIRQKFNIPRGTRYDVCRSVHSEMNAIISAPRKDMIGATLFLCGREKDTNDIIKNADCCSICKKIIINSGIETVIIRDSETDYRIVSVSDFVKNDDSQDIIKGY